MTMTLYSLRHRQRGVSLIEVLIAVLIFSLGLIGLAGLLVFATQSNHAAYLRTQATFLANSMADRMRANSVGVWQNNYNSASYPVTGTPPDCSGGCVPADLAKRDQILWSTMLTGLLPGAKADIECDQSKMTYVATTTDLTRRPPYGGACTMTITWNERGIADDRSAKPQTFAWVFQP